jgi:hypothetical protein
MIDGLFRRVLRGGRFAALTSVAVGAAPRLFSTTLDDTLV